MTAHFQTGADRAERRGAGVILFQPPDGMLSVCQWHMIETHLGRRRLQWRPGIDVWRGEDGDQRWTAAFAGQNGWTYVGVAYNQTDTARCRRRR